MKPCSVIFFILCVCFFISSASGDPVIKYAMDFEFSRESYMTILSVPFEWGGVFSVFPWIYGGSLWSPGLVEDVSTRFEWAGGLGLGYRGMTLYGGYGQFRIPVPFFFSYFRGLHLVYQTSIGDIKLKCKNYWGEFEQPEKIIDPGFMSSLQFDGMLFWEFNNQVQYSTKLQFVGSGPEKLESYGIQLSFPISLFNRMVYLEPQAGYIDTIQSTQQFPVAYDFTELSRVPIGRGKTIGDMYVGLESTFRVFPLAFTDLPIIRQLAIEATGDIGAYWQTSNLDFPKISYSFGTGPAWNILDSLLVIEMVFGYSSDDGFGFRLTVSRCY